MAKTKKQGDLPPWLQKQPDKNAPKGKPEAPPAKGKRVPPGKGQKGK